MTVLRHLLRCLATMGLVWFTTTNAKTIYRCGNSYSQTACTDAKVLQIDDARDANRKKEVEAATRRDTKLAKELERDRLKRLQQEQATAPQKSRHPNQKEPRVTPIKAPKNQVVLIKPTRTKPALRKTQDFTAQTPDSEKKTNSKKHAAKAKSATSK